MLSDGPVVQVDLEFLNESRMSVIGRYLNHESPGDNMLLIAFMSERECEDSPDSEDKDTQVLTLYSSDVVRLTYFEAVERVY